MGEAKLGRVKGLAVKAKLVQYFSVRFSRPTVDRIADQGMADRGHMHANLVGPAGFQPAFDQCGVLEDVEPFPMGHGALAARPSLTIAIFLRLADDRASGASMYPPLVLGTPETIAR